MTGALRQACRVLPAGFFCEAQMDASVSKILTMPVGQRYTSLKEMATYNDPKVILHLTDEWEYQAKVSSILSLKLRADAYSRRGETSF